ncbi:peptidase MA family metallohydrolase [Candidatus Poribacteria bacterium]
MMVSRGFLIAKISRCTRIENCFRVVFCILCLVSFVAFLTTPECLGQSFGKNKITSRHFEWLTYKTSHFTIYYYPAEERLVRTMADTAEIAYAKISNILEHDIKKNTPLILYKSHGDFQQTNVTLEALSEGVGGFAELLKYRVVIPFTGSMDAFQKVLTHEITHIFEYDVLYKDIFAHIYTGEFLRSPPIWFLEGLAEYMADHWDAQGEMVLRDAVISDSIVPLIYLQDFSRMGARVYLGYKQGQSAVQYLAEKYGNDKLAAILRGLGDSRSKDIDSALRDSIGISLEEFDKEWRQALKEQYWPMIADRQNPGSVKTNLTKENRKSPYSVRPKWSPSGDLIAYITYQDGYEEIRIISAKDGKLFSKPAKALRGKRYDSIREKGNGLAWSPDGDKIAFIGMKKDKDFLLAVNVVTGELTDWIEMPFDAAHSPSWSPDGKYVAVVGFKDGRSDLYVFRLEDALMARLTSDAYDESSLAWHPSERKIVYSSERNGRYKLFMLDLPTQQSRQLTRGSQNDVSPSWSPDGKRIVFCSDINDIYDVCTINSDGEDFTKLTNTLTGCYTPVFSPDEDSIALTIYHEGRNDIYVLNSDDFLSEKIAFPPDEEIEEPLYVIDERSVRGVGYSLNFVPDMIYVDFGYLSGSGVQNTVQITVSDIMGDHRLMAGVDFASYRNGPDFQLAYYFLRKRLDFGGALFNWNDFHIEGDSEFWQRSTGIAGYLSYPLDQFNRIDLQAGRYWRFLDFVGEETDRSENESLNLLSLSLVRDVVMWSSFGPYSGMRYNLSLEQTVKLVKRDLQMTNIMLDVRKYLKLGQRSNLSVRVMGAGSMGPDRNRETFFLGGTFRQSQAGFYFPKSLMRGYDFEEIAGNRVGLLNLEIRIPFIDELRFGWPFSWGLGGIRGVVFMDFAGVWPRPRILREGQIVNATDIHGEPIVSDKQFDPWINDEAGFRLLDLRSAIGAGFRIGPLSFDFAKKTDLRDLGDGYKFHFALGQEF